MPPLRSANKGIIFMARDRIRESLTGVVTDLATSPAVVVAGGTGGTRGIELALDIGDAGL